MELNYRTDSAWTKHAEASGMWDMKFSRQWQGRPFRAMIFRSHGAEKFQHGFCDFTMDDNQTITISLMECTAFTAFVEYDNKTPASQIDVTLRTSNGVQLMMLKTDAAGTVVLPEPDGVLGDCRVQIAIGSARYDRELRQLRPFPQITLTGRPRPVDPRLATVFVEQAANDAISEIYRAIDADELTFEQACEFARQQIAKVSSARSRESLLQSLDHVQSLRKAMHDQRSE